MSTRVEAGSLSPGPASVTLTGRNLVPLAATLLVGASAALLDTTIVAVALDDLGRDLGAAVTAVHWVTTAYLLAMAAVIPLVGWSVDRFGARAVWRSALGLFLLGSVLSGLAWSIGSLVTFRAVQGLGGGLILPVTQLVLARAAGPGRLGRVLGVVGLVGQLAPVSGPPLGGLLVDGWGWRWIFLVNVPLVLVALAMTGRWFPPDRHRSDQPLDRAGAVLLPAGVVTLLAGLSALDGGSAGAVRTVLASVAGTVLLAAFVVRSLRLTRRGRTSLIDPRLFADRSFRGGTALMFVLGVTTWGPMFLLPLYYQQLRGLSAWDAGLMLAPQSAGLALAYLLIGRYVDRLPPRPLAAAGMAVATAGTLPFAVATAATDPVPLGVALLVRGIGVGVSSLPIAAAVYRTLRPAAIPGATSASTVVQRVGAAVGTALLALVIQASGFGSALGLMFVLTALGLAATVLLPGRPTAEGEK